MLPLPTSCRLGTVTTKLPSESYFVSPKKMKGREGHAQCRQCDMKTFNSCWRTFWKSGPSSSQLLQLKLVSTDIELKSTALLNCVLQKKNGFDWIN